MPEQKSPQFKPEFNKTYNVELKFDEPKTGEGQYGTWYMYAVLVDGVDHIWFPNEYQRPSLEGYGKGSKFSVTATPVEREGGKVYKRLEIIAQTKKEDKPEPAPYVATTPDWDKIAEGKVRHGVAIEAYKLGKTLNVETATEIDGWVGYIMSGSLDQTTAPNEEPVDDLPF